MSSKKLGGGAKCPRCNLTVYHAEAAMAGKMQYHNSCFACKTCTRKLDRGTVCVDEKAKEIYCNGCYKKLKGCAGYGYGIGAGALQMDGGGGKNASSFERALAMVPKGGAQKTEPEACDEGAAAAEPEPAAAPEE